MKKYYLCISIAVLTILLAACQSGGQRKQAQTSSSPEASRSQEPSSTSQLSSSSSSSQSSSQQVQVPTERKTLWNADKAAELGQFMQVWGQKMGQSYQSYSPERSVNFYGLRLPGDLYAMQPVLNNQPVNIAWSPSGEEAGIYNLVAVYSDIEATPMGGHLYYFVIKDGYPYTWVTMQNQGNPQNYLHFKETENQELKAGFEKIVNKSPY